MSINPRLLDILVCPQDGQGLSVSGGSLVCAAGHQYPVVGDVPIFLLDNVPQTLWVADASLQEARGEPQRGAEDRYYLGTLGISEDERSRLRELLARSDNRIDPVVAFLVGATNGIAYQHLIGKLPDYPIPELRLPPGHGRILLDVGCNWGRWCMAAARKGYLPIGIDPSLGAVLAAKRVAAQLGLDAEFVVGDARFLPFRGESIDTVFSYSVLQHLSREDVANAVNEMGRVLRRGGKSLVQMPTVLGLRCLYHQARRRFREAREFEVRYWSVPALRHLFAERVGPVSVSVDCFFGIGLQAADLRLMPLSHRVVIRASEMLRKVSRVLPGLCYVADSVYLESVRANPA